MSIDNIVTWCDKHIHLVSLLKCNFKTFISTEVPHVEANFNEIQNVEANTTCVTKLLDKYLFILAMMAPTSIYNLMVEKINSLKVVVNNYISMKNNNDTQLQYIMSRLDDRFINQYLK